MKLFKLHLAVAMMAIVVLGLSCGFLGTAVPQTGETPGALPSADPETVSPTPEDGSSGEFEELTDPRVEATLALRSVQMELVVAYPDEDPNQILVAVDAAGNIHIEMATPVNEETRVTPESPDWNVAEIFVVDGMAYSRMGRTGNAESAPDEHDALSLRLYNPNGPGMWLILLPEENFTPAGAESRGGFDAEKYIVDGSLDMGEIQGEFWVDEQTGALVGANLTLSESILRPAEEGTNRVVTISFSVEKADVAPIVVP